MAANIDQLLTLPVDEKLEIVDRILESIKESNEDLPVPQWHLEILEERYQKHKNSLTSGKSWEEVKKTLAG